MFNIAFICAWLLEPGATGQDGIAMYCALDTRITQAIGWTHA